MAGIRRATSAKKKERKHLLDDAAAISVEVSERLLQLLRNDPASPLRSALPTE